MIGAYLTFLAACVLVAIYMTVVHCFLRSCEEDDGDAEKPRERHA